MKNMTERTLKQDTALFRKNIADPENVLSSEQKQCKAFIERWIVQDACTLCQFLKKSKRMPREAANRIDTAFKLYSEHSGKH